MRAGVGTDRRAGGGGAPDPTRRNSAVGRVGARQAPPQAGAAGRRLVEVSRGSRWRVGDAVGLAVGRACTCGPRGRRRRLVVNNGRFLAHCQERVLALNARRLSGDREAIFGHPVLEATIVRGPRVASRRLPPHHRLAGVAATGTSRADCTASGTAPSMGIAARLRTGNGPRAMGSLRNLAIEPIRNCGWRGIPTGLRHSAVHPPGRARPDRRPGPLPCPAARPSEAVSAACVALSSHLRGTAAASPRRAHSREIFRAPSPTAANFAVDLGSARGGLSPPPPPCYATHKISWAFYQEQ